MDKVVRSTKGPVQGKPSVSTASSSGEGAHVNASVRTQDFGSEQESKSGELNKSTCVQIKASVTYNMIRPLMSRLPLSHCPPIVFWVYHEKGISL